MEPTDGANFQPDSGRIDANFFSMNDFDVIVLGGGPAGSTAGAFLAKEGKRVLVLEKERFPRFHVGESLLPYNKRLFAEMGLLEKMEGMNFMQKNGAQFWLGNGKSKVDFLFRDGTFNEETTAFQVERSVFDEMLLRNAATQGATVREECTVMETAIHADSVSVTYRENGEERTATGKFLMDATGQANFTGNREGIKESFEGHRKVAMFGHFSGIELPQGERQGDIIIVRLEDGWFWIIPLSPEKVSVGLVIDVKRWKDSGFSPKEMFDSVVAGSSAVKEKMEGSELIGKIHVVSDFSYQNRRFASPRLVRVGDAAGFLDPIFSSGVYLAMTSARDGAMAVAKALDRNAAFDPMLAKYEKKLRAEMAQYWKLIKNYYTTPFIDLFMTPDPPLNLRSAVNSILAGRLNPSWAVRWRLWAFYWCVKIQKKFPLAPRTDFA